MSGMPIDIVSALYDAADDHDIPLLDDLMIRAGILWRCKAPRRGWTCGWINRADETKCGGCGKPRSRERVP